MEFNRELDMWLQQHQNSTNMDLYAKYCHNDVIATEAAFKNINKENSQMHAIKIEKVIKNDDAVVVLWSDKTKTVVKLMAGDTDDIYSAVAQAMAKKIYGGTGKFHSHVDKVLKDYTTYFKIPDADSFERFWDGGKSIGRVML